MAHARLSFLREGSFFACELPMHFSAEAAGFLSGVRSVFRASAIKKAHGRRSAAPIGVVLTMFVAVLATSLLLVPTARAQSENQIMAAFLFNFARYVEWPKDAFDRSESPVGICIFAADDFADVVNRTVSGKRVGKRPVVVRSITKLERTRGCHILFIGRDFNTAHDDAVVSLRGQSVFSVSDRKGFAKAGGIANFIRAENRIRFEINPRAAKAAGLKISSRLLRLAKVVR